MTGINVQSPRILYLGAGSAGPFALQTNGTNWTFADQGVIKATRFNSDGVGLAEVGFTVSPITVVDSGQTGASITLTTVLNSGETLLIERDSTFAQTLDLTPTGGFPSAAVKARFDRTTEWLQELESRLTRAVSLGPLTDPSAVTPNLPGPVAGAFLGWDGNADGLVNYSGVAPTAPFEIDELSGSAPDLRIPRTDASRWATRIAIAGRDFGLRADGASDDSATINKVMADMDVRGGGRLQIGGQIGILHPLNNAFNRVLVEGWGYEGHNDGGNQYATKIIPLASFAADSYGVSSALILRSPYGASNFKKYGGGFKGMAVVANGQACRHLHIDAVNGFDVQIASDGCLGDAAVYTKSAQSGVQLIEAGDVQKGYLRLDINLIGGNAAAHGLLLEGSTTGSDTSLIEVYVDVYHVNGHGVLAQNCDAVHFRFLRAFQVGGTGYGYYGKVGKTGPPISDGAAANYFDFFQANGNYYLEGTEVSGGVNPAGMIVERFSTDGININSGHVGTGCMFRAKTDAGVEIGAGSSKLAIGDSNAAAILARSLLGSESLRIINASGSGFVIANGDNSVAYLFAPDNGGEFLIGSVLAGSNPINLGAGAAVKIPGNIGFHGTSPTGKPTITGSRAANVALTSLLSQLAAIGLVTDSTS